MFVSMVRIGLCRDQLHAHRRGQVIHLVHLGHQPPHQGTVGHRTLDVAKLRVAEHGGQVGHRAGRFVVHHRDAMAAGQQRLGQMAADETCAAGDQNVLHGVVFFPGTPATQWRGFSLIDRV